MKITDIVQKLNNIRNCDYQDLANENGYQLDNLQDLTNLIIQMIEIIDDDNDRSYYEQLLLDII